MTIKLELTEQELSLVVNALGNLPFRQVCQIMNKLEKQATLQLTEKEGQHETLASDSSKATDYST